VSFTDGADTKLKLPVRGAPWTIRRICSAKAVLDPLLLAFLLKMQRRRCGLQPPQTIAEPKAKDRWERRGCGR
jgi:hypothetical protein